MKGDEHITIGSIWHRRGKKHLRRIVTDYSHGDVWWRSLDSAGNTNGGLRKCWCSTWLSTMWKEQP